MKITRKTHDSGKQIIGERYRAEVKRERQEGSGWGGVCMHICLTCEFSGAWRGYGEGKGREGTEKEESN